MTLTEPKVVHEIVLLKAIETDGGIPLEPGDVGVIADVLGSDYILEFQFDDDTLEGGSKYDTACVSADAFVIIAFS